MRRESIFKFISLIGSVLLLFAIVFYYWILNYYLINIPFADEYGTTLNWLNEYINTQSIFKRITLLFHQANEHRIFTCYFTTWVDYSIFGYIDFKRLLWVANFGMIIIFLLVKNLFDEDQSNPWVILPVALLIFVPQHAVSDWGVVALASVFQYSMAFASMILLSKPGKWRLIFAIFFAFFTTFSFGNGMFIFISGYLVLFLIPQKSIKTIVIWTISTILSISLYFTEYNFSKGAGFSSYYLQHPIETIQFFLTFVGGIFQPFIKTNLIYYAIYGSLVLIIFCYIVLFKWKQAKKNTVALAIALFIILSVAASSISRVEFGISGATSPRYVLFQVIFLVILYLLIFDVFRKYKKGVVALAILLIGVLYYNRMLHNFNQMELHKNQLKKEIFYYHADYKKIKSSNPIAIKNILDQSKKTGIYTPPSIQELYPEIELLKTEKPIGLNEKINYRIEKFDNLSLGVNITGWAFLEASSHVSQKIAVILKSESSTMIFSTVKVMREDVAYYLKNTYPEISKNIGFQFVLEKDKFIVQDGSYRVGIGILENEKLVSFIYTDYLVDF